jgi:hypothetical protein
VFAGTGLGRKTFGQITGDLDPDTEAVRKRLKKVDIRVNDDDKLKDLADKHNTTPIKILTLILIEDSYTSSGVNATTSSIFAASLKSITSRSSPKALPQAAGMSFKDARNFCGSG